AARGRLLIIDHTGALEFWNPVANELLARCTEIPEFQGPVAIRDDGKELAALVSKEDDGWELHLWDFPTAGRRVVLESNLALGIRGLRGALHYSPDGRWLALVDTEGRLYLRNLQSQSRPHGFDGIHTFTFSPDSRWLALGLESGEVCLLELSSLQTCRI